MFNWITKPHLMMSFLDYVFMYAELGMGIMLASIICGFIGVQADARRRNKSRLKDGTNCTCWKCMGVRR